jgi:hypothetical protein
MSYMTDDMEKEIRALCTDTENNYADKQILVKRIVADQFNHNYDKIVIMSTNAHEPASLEPSFSIRVDHSGVEHSINVKTALFHSISINVKTASLFAEQITEVCAVVDDLLEGLDEILAQ